ncbi:MAG: MATE family efflux transporter [Gemmatimonadetes bacterium]|nr:MATE family efflux transporter [Gemmatimonadota bacterium]
MASKPIGATGFDRSLVEGPIGPAVWKLAWPTMLQNIFGGLQGMVDHAMVGHYVGFTGNAAIGVSWQIFLVVMVFISSLFTGMGVLVARFAGAGDAAKANRTVYQAFLTSTAISLLILAPVGYLLSPTLLQFVKATPEVRAEALPYLRTMFVFSFGMLTFFMLGGALRSAGDAKTPLRYGIALTVLNIVLNVIFIAGLGPIPALGTAGAAVGTVLAGGILSVVAFHRLVTGKWVVGFPKHESWRPDWDVIRSLFRFGLPTGLQGVAMNVGGVLLLRYIGSLEQSAEAQAAYSVGYGQLFSLIIWTSVGLMGATGAVVGQNLGARHPERAIEAVSVSARVGLMVAAVIGLLFLVIPRLLLEVFGMTDPTAVGLAVRLLQVLAVSGFFISLALVYTGGLQGAGDTKSPFYISLLSQILVPLGGLAVVATIRPLVPLDVWLAILLGHITRAALSITRFRQGRWRTIAVDIRGH